jgi:hypothetical protein
VIGEYLAHYYAKRNYQGLENVIPFPNRRLEAREWMIVKPERLGVGGAEFLPLTSRLKKFAARLPDSPVASRSRRRASCHAGLEVSDDLAKPKRRFVPSSTVPVALVWQVGSRAPKLDGYFDPPL